MDAAGQIICSIVVLALVMFASNEVLFPQKYLEWFRVLTIILGLALTFRYLIWRGIYTLTAPDWISLVAVWLLFLAEIYAGITHILGCIINAYPLRRPLRSIEKMNRDTLPSVDVMVPTYNEAEDLLEITLRAALMMDYPSNKLKVHLLDDGSTEQKLADSDPAKRKIAVDRKESLTNLADRLGVTYHTRAKNEFAKAGNLNSAFENTHGDLVVVLDADHVPTSDFLSRTVPWMVSNEKVFLVQTPHFMANPDPVERNYFNSFSKMPSENDMFYGTVQKGLDYWNSSFFCGSAAVLRRKHLELVGGISGESITEDAETALDLHKMGYQSVYVDHTMVSGLAPETFEAFIQQRMRWAQGMTQILLLKKPFMAEGLSWFQRVGYMSSILFWLFPFARVIFLMMPLAYLVFGLQVYHASLIEVIAFTIPHVIATYSVSTMLFGRTRWPLVSELYEILQCIFTLNAIIKVMRKPRSPAFVVTPKGKSLDESFISPMSKVFYVLLVLITLASISGIDKFINEPLTRKLTVIVLIWNTFNLLLILSAIGVLLERKQIRGQARLPATDSVSLEGDDGKTWTIDLLDLSVSGVKARIRGNAPYLSSQLTLLAWSEAMKKNVALPCELLQYDSKSASVRLHFYANTENEKNELIAYTLCNSGRWQSFKRRRTRPIRYLFGIKHILLAGVRPVALHFLIVSKLAITNLYDKIFFNKEKQQ